MGTNKKNKTFGNLLKIGLNSAATLEGKNGPHFDDEIGSRVGLAGSSLQRFRSGDIPRPEMVTVFAEICVEQGLMSRRWLERFLEVARYPVHEARALIGRLFPEDARDTRRQRIRLELPPPTYSQFVMRPAAYSAVLGGLRSELPATIIVSMGGMGKTSLARAVAGACLDGRESAPRFVAVAWISDRKQPGTTILSIVLDTIARVLDYPGLTGLAHSDKLREIGHLLQAHSTLIVVDNAETIGDGALLEWLTYLPHPSKALITSRIALPALTQDVAVKVELEPMDARESRELMATRLENTPALRKIPNALTQLLPIAEAVGGNPKAIEIALGLVQQRSLPEVLADLSAARSERLFEDLFSKSWALLDAAAQRVLLAMYLFPNSASSEVLTYVADLLPGIFQRVTDQLAELSLLDFERADLLSPPRYAVHPLVRAFAGARLRETASEPVLRERWLAWYTDLAASVGFCWDNLDRLDRLDPEYETVQAALEWAAVEERHRATIALAEGVRYYYNVRGLWDKQRLKNYEHRASAARHLHDSSELVLTLAQQAEVQSKQATLEAARGLLDQAEREAQDVQLSDDAAFELSHARALLAYANGDFSTAEVHWRALLPFAAGLGGQKYVINRRWLATCLLDQGRTDEAAALYRESLADAEACNDTRSVAGNSLKLAAIEIQRGDLSAAVAALERSRILAERHQDRRRLAEYHRLTAQLRAAQGDIDGAQEAGERAVDLFSRMGMSREAEAARAAVAQSRTA